MLLSAGERISMALLSMAIRELRRRRDQLHRQPVGHHHQRPARRRAHHRGAAVPGAGRARARQDRGHRRLPGRVVPQGGDDARPRRQRHDRGRDGRGARRRVLRNLLGRRRRVFRRSARGPSRAAHRHAVVRGNAGDGGGGREGAQCPGGRIRKGERDRDLRARDRRSAARSRPSSDGTVVRRIPPRMPGTVVGVASERDVIVLEADARRRRSARTARRARRAGKQLHVFADRTTVAISRENLHDEERLRDRAADAALAAGRDWSMASRRSAWSARASTPATRTSAPACDALQAARHPTRWHRHVLVPDHVDDPARATDDAVRALHARFIDVATTAAAVGFSVRRG